MWLLPWEKLPPLILGPLLIFVGVFVFLVADARDGTAQMESLWWDVGAVVVGVAVTVYGVIKERRKQS